MVSVQRMDQKSHQERGKITDGRLHQHIINKDGEERAVSEFILKVEPWEQR